MQIIVLGGSFTGKYLAENFSVDHDIAIVSRYASELRDAGYRAFYSSDTLPFFPDLVIDTIPAISDSSDIKHPYLDLIESIRQRKNNSRQPHFCHISSTSVYPRHNNQLYRSPSEAIKINEKIHACPDSERGRKRRDLELHILQLFPDALIVRAGGIYGSSRNLVKRFLQNDFSMVSDDNRFVSRIHVHDLCRIIIAASYRRFTDPDFLFNGADGNLIHAVDCKPSSQNETYSFIEKTYGIEIPGNWRDQPYNGRMITSLYTTDLIGPYKYPSYREGLRQSHTLL